MKIQLLDLEGVNTGKLKQSLRGFIEIKKGRYIQGQISHPLFNDEEPLFTRIYGLHFDGKRIYYLNLFGVKNENSGNFIGLTRVQKHRFLWMQGKHWLQKEENIRYIVNLIFLLIGVYIALKNIKS